MSKSTGADIGETTRAWLRRLLRRDSSQQHAPGPSTLTDARQFHGPRQRSSNRSGFTAIEVLVVLTLVAVLVGLAAPSFRRVSEAAAISSSVNQFLADMRFARSEAIRRGGGVVLCRSDDPEAATANCSSSSDSVGWESGWIVFHDLDGNATRATNESLLRAQARHTRVDSISAESTPTIFRFAPTGRLLGTVPTSTLRFGGLTLEADLRRVVCVGAGGRARVAGDGTASCGANG